MRKYIVWREGSKFQLTLPAEQLRADDRIKMLDGTWRRANSLALYHREQERKAEQARLDALKPKLAVDINPTKEGLVVQASVSTPLTTTTAHLPPIPWWVVAAGVAGAAAGATVAHIQNKRDEERQRKLRARRRRRLAA